jgi:CSLREA domain-containing protein
MFVMASTVSAQIWLEITVNSSADDNVCNSTCTLRGAINFINTYNNPYPSRPRIVFSQQLTVDLQSDLPAPFSLIKTVRLPCEALAHSILTVFSTETLPKSAAARSMRGAS